MKRYWGTAIACDDVNTPADIVEWCQADPRSNDAKPRVYVQFATLHCVSFCCAEGALNLSSMHMRLHLKMTSSNALGAQCADLCPVTTCFRRITMKDIEGMPVDTLKVHEFDVL